MRCKLSMASGMFQIQWPLVTFISFSCLSVNQTMFLLFFFHNFFSASWKQIVGLQTQLTKCRLTVWKSEVHTSDSRGRIHQTSPSVRVPAIRRRGIIPLPLWEEQHLSSISWGFWLRVRPLSLTHAPIGSSCGMGCWERTAIFRELFGTGQQQDGICHGCSCGPLLTGCPS